MLSKHGKGGRNQLEIIALDDLVPADHLVRKIEDSIDSISLKSGESYQGVVVGFNLDKGESLVRVGERKGISHKNTWKESSKRKINIYRYQTSSLFMNGFGMILPKAGVTLAV